MGTVQFPQIIVDIDKEIRFSGLLLQRAPRDTQELLSVYGALLAHGTARSVSEVSLMMPGVSMDAISDAQSVLERGNVLRTPTTPLSNSCSINSYRRIGTLADPCRPMA